MGDYSTNLRTQYLNARTHITNRRTEFRFDKNTLYQTNLRLINLGLKKAGGTGVYNSGAGILGTLQNVRLMDGSRELSSLRNAPAYLGFKNINATHEKVQNIHDVLHKSKASFQLDGGGDLEDPVDSSNQIPQDTFDPKQNGYIDLRLVLPLLTALPALDTSVFKNLRIVIEYATLTVFASRNKTDVLTLSEPTLVADEVIGDKKMKVLKSAMQGGVVWSEIEHDLFTVPEAPQPAGGGGQSELVQSISAVVNGFDNKYVSRVLVVKQPNNKSFDYDTNIDRGNGNIQSRAQFKEKLNVRHKGSNLFNGDGLENVGFRQMLLSETFGDVCVPPFGASTSIGLDPNGGQALHVSGQLQVINVGAAQKKAHRIGQYDYLGFQMEDVVRQLQFSYERTALKTDAVNVDNVMALDVHLYAEVRKSLTFTSGNYDVSYA